MFKDYYKILDVSPNATAGEIKEAFRKQAFKWHPDRNLGRDTTFEMQEINEAYLILKDFEARAKYDKEYNLYTQSKAKVDYEIKDEVLKKWMNTAKKQAVDLAKETIKDMGTLTKVGVKEAGIEMGRWTLSYIIIGIIFSLLFGIGRGCS